MSTVRSVRALALALVLLVPAAARADMLLTKDGRIFDGKVMHRVDAGIEVKFEHGTVLVPQALVFDAVLEEDKNWVPATDEEKAQAAKGMIRFDKKWMTPKQRDELVAKRVEERKRLFAEMKARREWRNRQILDTKYFRWEHTLPDHVFEPYRDAMEAYFGEFARTWKIKAPKNEDRLPVNFHLDEDTFHQISAAPPGVIGYFRYVKPYDLAIFYERLDPTRSESVMFHESNHYLQQLIDQQFAMPHFPGESLAEYYGASTWDPVKKKLTTGLIQEGRLCEIQSDIDAGQKLGLHKMITTDGMYEHYTWGWSFVHFLMNDAKNATKFQRFFLALHEAKGVVREPAGRGDMFTLKPTDVLVVFMREMGLKDASALREMEVRWYDYIDTKLKLVTVTGIERAAFQVKQDGRKLKATRLFKEAIEKGSTNALVFRDLADLHRAEGRWDEAAETYKRALAIDPLNGDFYGALAKILDKRDQPECDRLLGLAKELGFDDPWANIEIDLDGDGKPDEPTPGDKPKGS
jgi:hypothetical protein